MPITQALATLAYPNLPSGAFISFSELSTFESCQRQHFWRYFTRLSSKRYLELRHMVIGSVVHECVEQSYRNRAEDQQDIYDRVHKKFVTQYTSPSYLPYFDNGQFKTDMVAAREMYRTWYTELFLTEGFADAVPEIKFEVEIAGQKFLGYIDQLYQIEGGPQPGLYIGEVKTRGASFKKGLKLVVERDLQNKIYLAAMMLKGHEPQGVVYTVINKPPQALLEPMGGDPERDQEQIDAIRAHYATPIHKTHYRREILPVDLDLKALEADIEERLIAMDAFYSNPYASVEAAPVLDERRFPCAFCEFAPMCHDGADVDGSFRYKRRRET
jgi:hypothetical protein